MLIGHISLFFLINYLARPLSSHISFFPNTPGPFPSAVGYRFVHGLENFEIASVKKKKDQNWIIAFN